MHFCLAIYCYTPSAFLLFCLDDSQNLCRKIGKPLHVQPQQPNALNTAVHSELKSQNRCIYFAPNQMLEKQDAAKKKTTTTKNVNVNKVSFCVYFKPDLDSRVPVWIHGGQRSADSAQKRVKMVPANIQLFSGDYFEKLK